MCRDLGSEALIGHDFIARRCSRNSDANPVCRDAYDEGRKGGDRSGRRVAARRLPKNTRCHKCNKECHLQLVAVGLSVAAAGIAPASHLTQIPNRYAVTESAHWAGRNMAGRTRHSASWSQTGTVWHQMSHNGSWNWCGLASRFRDVERTMNPVRWLFETLFTWDEGKQIIVQTRELIAAAVAGRPDRRSCPGDSRLSFARPCSGARDVTRYRPRPARFASPLRWRESR